jgi:hypothetical protein
VGKGTSLSVHSLILQIFGDGLVIGLIRVGKCRGVPDAVWAFESLGDFS